MKIESYPMPDGMEQLCADMASSILSEISPLNRATKYDDLRLTRRVYVELPVGWHEVVGFHIIGSTPETVKPLMIPAHDYP